MTAKIGGTLLPKMTLNVIISGLSPNTSTVRSLIMCVSTSFKNSCVFVMLSPLVHPSS